VFGVPLQRTTEEEIARDAKAAVRCAVRMVERLQKLNQQWQAKGLPTTTMRAGIATGIVVAGSLGSRQRLNYTIIGDTANVASRLESYNKSFGEEGSRILIGDRTYQYIREDFSTQFVDSAQLKGKSQPVKIYRVLGSAPDRRK
ncbi:MAG: adenylate/guanylate cyclase domain-containing protein, partial [Spirulina sp.]